MELKKKKVIYSLLMLMTAAIWGVSFVFLKSAAEHMGTFTFNYLRCFIGAGFLVVVNIFITKSRAKHGKSEENQSFLSKPVLYGGLLSGVAMFGNMAFQQIGMHFTEASKAGFINSMYIVMVPVLGLFYGKKSTLKMWLCIIGANVGMYFLSIKNGFTMEKGGLLILIAAFFIALQIVIIDIVANKADPIKLTIIELLTVSMLSLPIALFKETVTLEQIKLTIIPLLYTGILSQGIGFTIQALGQKYIQPTVTSLIFSSSSIFAALGGSLLIGEFLTGREYMGCAIMFVAIVLSQISLPKLKAKKE